jgi:hypothetical protein
MDRLAAQVVATAVLTAALAAVPAAMAKPTSDASVRSSAAVSAPSAAAAPSVSASASTAAHAPAAATTMTTEPKSAAATPSPTQVIPCADAYQVGTTAYARWHGMVAFSVKEYYSPSCHAVYGYAFPWLQFRLQNAHYDLGMAVFDVTHDAIDGARTFLGGAGGPDFWSAAVSVPPKTCTEGLAHVFYPDTETDTYTVKFCQ